MCGPSQHHRSAIFWPYDDRIIVHLAKNDKMYLCIINCYNRNRGVHLNTKENFTFIKNGGRKVKETESEGTTDNGNTT